MADGPTEYLIVEFSGTAFHGELVAALNDLVSSATIRIIDLLLVSKDTAGNVEVIEIDDLADDVRELFTDLDGEYGGLFSQDDIDLAAAALEPGRMAAVIVFENTWAARFVAALHGVDATVVANERIPEEILEAALGELATAEAVK